MKKYYKGTIGRLIPINYNEVIASFNHDFGWKKVTLSVNPNTVKEYPELIKYITSDKISNILKDNDESIKVTSPKVLSEIETEYSSQLRYDESLQIEIIFEIFEDQYGNTYGKELISGLIFPILLKNLIEYEVQIYKKVMTRNMSLVIPKEYIFLQVNSLPYKYDTTELIDSLIIKNSLAPSSEVQAYLDEYDEEKAPFGQRKKVSKKRKEFISLITSAYNKNIYLQEIKPKEKQELTREKTSMLISTMENIEFLLRKLRKIDKSQADLYEQEYLQLLKEDNQSITLTPLNQITLSNLEAKIELAITLKKRNSSDIREFLESFKEVYLDEFINGSTEQTKLTISELDKITELFLRTKECYTVQEQRNISKSISFIYLMEVYENKDTIDSSDLENSYFSDNLKGIIIYIETLMELGIIKKNMIVDLEQELTVDYILNLIKKIEFNIPNQQSIKTLIKDIG